MRFVRTFTGGGSAAGWLKDISITYNDGGKGMQKALQEETLRLTGEILRTYWSGDITALQTYAHPDIQWIGTRDQECYRFENAEDFRDIIQARYRLIPYLYRTFRKASEENGMIFRPLSFDYPDDKIARECETQLMLGEECMIAPVYEQNVSGRYVYLPEDMTFVKLSGEKVTKQELGKGVHYVDIALNEVPLFIKKGKSIELCKPAMRTALLDTENLEYI